MKCPDLQILSRYQDGGLDEETARRVQEHLVSCPACEERFRTLGKLGLFLRIGLGRAKDTPCLSAEELGAYLAGGVKTEHREQIETHLAGCQRCLHEVAVFSNTELETVGEGSPVPTRRALTGFAGIYRRAWRSGRTRRVLVYSSRVALTAAAAVMVVVMMFPIPLETKSVKPVPRDVARVGDAEKPDATSPGLREGIAMLSSLGDEADTLVSEHSSLARFARQMRLILHQTMEAASSPTEERVAMLKEDVLSSGLVNSVEELSGEIKDPRIQRFLVDCKCVLLKVAKIDKDDPANDLIALVNEIQHLYLSELARLMELEGGGSLWLTASL